MAFLKKKPDRPHQKKSQNRIGHLTVPYWYRFCSKRGFFSSSKYCTLTRSLSFLRSTQDLAVMLDKSREHLCSRGKMEIVENPVVINGDIPHMPSGQHSEDDIDIGKIQDEVGAIAKKSKGTHSLLLLVYV